MVCQGHVSNISLSMTPGLDWPKMVILKRADCFSNEDRVPLSVEDNV
jgi:hypothetical protein